MEQETSDTLFKQNGGPRFEIIPAKRIEKRTKDALPYNATLSVTCSPAKGVDATVETTIDLAPHFARVVPHIAARMMEGEEHLDKVLEKLQAHNLDEIFVVGGDQGKPLGPFKKGLDLVEALAEREHGFKNIGIPAYPEGHPNIDMETITHDFAAKAPYANYAVTQMCFDSDKVLEWLLQQRESGLQLAFYLGIPGPVRPDKLLRIAPRIGVTDSLRFLRKNLKLSGKLLRGYDASELVNAYTPYLNDPKYGIAGFHTYTFNELDTLSKFQAYNV